MKSRSKGSLPRGKPQFNCKGNAASHIPAAPKDVAEVNVRSAGNTFFIIRLLHLKTCFKHVYSNKVGSEDPEKNPEIVFSKQIQTKVSCSLDGDHSS